VFENQGPWGWRGRVQGESFKAEHKQCRSAAMLKEVGRKVELIRFSHNFHLQGLRDSGRVSFLRREKFEFSYQQGLVVVRFQKFLCNLFAAYAKYWTGQSPDSTSLILKVLEGMSL